MEIEGTMAGGEVLTATTALLRRSNGRRLTRASADWDVEDPWAEEDRLEVVAAGEWIPGCRWVAVDRSMANGNSPEAAPHLLPRR